MGTDILIVRDGDRYRLLHGQLHLASELSKRDEIRVDVREDGEVRIIKADGELLVEKGNRRFPLFRND
jgi:flagellar hook-associated protein FlgK